jgi:geranylgeranyl diphosphate synthase, type II
MPQTLNQYLDEIEHALQDYLAGYVEPRSLYDPIHYLFEGGGKRVRPLMTLLACEACGGDRAHAMPAALAIELMHNFTLLHDDIMDRSPMRRGRQTVHMRWNDNAAILSGDVMMGLAMRLVERSARMSTHPLDVMSAFSTGLIDVCDGQALDLELQTSTTATIEAYFDMITKKTARLLETSVALGAHVAGADTTIVDALRTFARNIGVAFQMQDDILDLIGSDDFGKQPGGDIVEGKRTWLFLSSEQRVASSEQRVGARHAAPSSVASSERYRAIIHAFNREHGLPAERVPEVRAMMEDLGVLDDARILVQRMTEDAVAHLHVLPETPARMRLEELGKQLMARTT